MLISYSLILTLFKSPYLALFSIFSINDLLVCRKTLPTRFDPSFCRFDQFAGLVYDVTVNPNLTFITSLSPCLYGIYDWSGSTLS